MEITEHYIPALGYHWLTPLYDQMVRRFMREDMLRGHLVMQADILPGMRVLDLGCGTGSLTVMIKQSHLMSDVYGLDADPQVLKLARSKAKQANVKIAYEQGMAYQLPYPDAWFDRVVTSLVLHHLTTEQKQQALNEVYRVLRPGGKFFILDFGKPRSLYTRIVSQILSRTEQVDDNIRGLIPGFIQKAGFTNVYELESFGIIVGDLSLYRAEKRNGSQP